MKASCVTILSCPSPVGLELNWTCLNGTGTQQDGNSSGLVLNKADTQRGWNATRLEFSGTGLILNETGTQRVWYSVGLELIGTGTQCDWYSMRLEFIGTGTL